MSGLQRLRAGQIRGVEGVTLHDDIGSIINKAQTYDKPVPSRADLPLEGNDDGDVRLVLDEDVFALWDEPTQKWLIRYDKSTEKRTTNIPSLVKN